MAMCALYCYMICGYTIQKGKIEFYTQEKDTAHFIHDFGSMKL
jgi:hypothetical protein